VTRAYLGLVAVSDRRLRDFGALAMQGPAARAAYWRGRTQAFPGLPLLAVRSADRSSGGTGGASATHGTRAASSARGVTR
jgi:hypothetical protein